MRTFGNITFSLCFLSGATFLAAYLFTDQSVAIAFPGMLFFAILLNIPIIRTGNGRVAIFTLNPFQKNINVAVEDVQYVAIEAYYNTRYTFEMKDGSVYSTLTQPYSFDILPLHKELKKNGVAMQTDANSLIDL